MEFIVELLINKDNLKPCDEAYEKEFTKIDERNTNDPYSIKGLGEKWFKEGDNHRVENNHIKRDLGKVKLWCIKINDLKDIINFKNKYGDIVIEKCNRYISEKKYVIVIYNIDN